MELFQTAVDKGSPEAHLYLGMGYLCTSVVCLFVC